ncbi:tRNA(Ile)-lysidine synthase [Nocardia africana]|uniref:tRNA(Ile)-lysidine synthase n=2 Tax=Nocardia africana TaxID=134964 RepID=A0A378WJB2_9NOCA|nr:tRNA(Ile)-lysidine synthase [Nocardia africana]
MNPADLPAEAPGTDPVSAAEIRSPDDAETPSAFGPDWLRAQEARAADGARLPETRAVLVMRHAVRDWLARYAPAGVVAVALSGGADSLALTAAAVAEAAAADALIVDHGLQEGSAAVAEEAAEVARRLGCRSVRVCRVSVTGPGGPEAAARQARYAALDELRDGLPVLVGHTLDDQAETVLLGLARGSGQRSIQGMAEYDEPWGRPLLGVRRAVTREMCRDLALCPHEDPHNAAPEFTRVRLRSEVLPLLEEVLGGGVAPALARTAAQLREDGEALDAIADRLLIDARDGSSLSVETLATVPPAIRRRVIRAWLLDGGAKALTDKHLRAVESLITEWHGQGGVAVGGGMPGIRLVARRERGRLTLAFAR